MFWTYAQTMSHWDHSTSSAMIYSAYSIIFYHWALFGTHHKKQYFGQLLTKHYSVVDNLLFGLHFYLTMLVAWLRTSYCLVILRTIIHLILTATLRTKDYLITNYTRGILGTDRLNNLPKATQLSGITRVWTQTLESLPLNSTWCCFLNRINGLIYTNTIE